jgi:hypothetical protein
VDSDFTRFTRFTTGGGNHAKYTDEVVSGSARRLTEEEAHQVKKLVSEGMAPRYARTAVLGKDQDEGLEDLCSLDWGEGGEK